MSDKPVVVIGGGPAGLAAAYELGKRRAPAVLLEASPDVGGISRTVRHGAFRFDLGGHRFFTKSADVNALWREVLGDDFLRRPRLSRIYFRHRFFAYPMKPMDALLGLGLAESVLIGLSYLYRKAFPLADVSNFENWNINLFGERLYRHFFKTYTEKVWGIPCAQIAAEWGAQRIKGLSLWSAVKSALVKPRDGSIKTLIDEFDYPRFGPGQMYEAMAAKTEALGVPIHRNHRAIRIERDGSRVTAVVAATPDGEKRFPCSHVISTMPFSELALALSPEISPAALDAARGLTYRALLTVNLMFDGDVSMPDTWIYIHEPGLKMGRVQCFKNWSPAMVGEPGKSSLGCEYFASEGDDLWTMPDADLVALAKKEIGSLGLADASRVFDGFTVRVPKAYPVLDLQASSRVKAIREEITGIVNLFPAGRYGMFRYNNMDHSILTGLFAARNTGGASFDLWSVNADAEYHEEIRKDAKAESSR